MRIGLRHYGGETVDWLKARLGAGDCTRTFLARELCEREDWQNAKGELCLGRASEVLRRTRSAGGSVTPESLAPSPDYPDRHLSCRLGDLGVIPVADEDKSLARSMMASYHPDAACPGHPLLDSRPCTASSAAWRCVLASQSAGPPHRLAARDANIERVVNNDRFLPGVRGLASVALFHGRVTGRSATVFAWRTATWVRSIRAAMRRRAAGQGVAGVREAAVGGLVSRAGRVISSGPRQGRMAEYGRSAHSALSRWARPGAVVRVHR